MKPRQVEEVGSYGKSEIEIKVSIQPFSNALPGSYSGEYGSVESDRIWL
jgi:hypothetical protein